MEHALEGPEQALLADGQEQAGPPARAQRRSSVQPRVIRVPAVPA